MRLAIVLALALVAAPARAQLVLEELRVRAHTAVRDAQVCCNRLDDGSKPGRPLSPARRGLRECENAYSAGLHAVGRGELGPAREAFEDTIKFSKRVTRRCRGIGPRKR